MLQIETVSKDTLSILKKLMSIDELSEFYLAGGTSLALQLGHRLSVDLDFFGFSNLSTNEIYEILADNFQVDELSRSNKILILNIDQVKVDFVNYKYPLINQPLVYDGIRLLSIQDIAAMKLSAIKGRGRKKDFYDLYYLLEKFTLQELLDLHEQKFKDGTNYLVLKSIVYFEDADQDPDILLVKDSISWKEVKDRIITHFYKL